MLFPGRLTSPNLFPVPSKQSMILRGGEISDAGWAILGRNWRSSKWNISFYAIACLQGWLTAEKEIKSRPIRRFDQITAFDTIAATRFIEKSAASGDAHLRSALVLICHLG